MDRAGDLRGIRRGILRMVHRAGEGHIPSSFSIVEILYALYARMGADDAFFLSKGHASAGLYATLAHFGFLDQAELETFGRYESRLGGHPSNKVPSVLSASGSLGHGLPMAAGYALGKKIRGEDGTVFCLVGDGEANEGTIWEAAAHAVRLGLANLVCVIDDNESQARAMPSINLEEKFAAFGWEASTVDGHDLAALEKGLFGGAPASGAPRAVVARTIKGKGVKELERNAVAWHHKAPSAEQLAAFEEELSP
ncbi:MAG: transketolase [Patescibacteria group bacterium]|nr:transketolase [Patescibacteria group bacterium]MDE1943998.1 transketolase [Patescibacteria group bacterium]MDE1945068.1 transketolase [Patescibacteria group bacterium]MDE2057936.1 transketolase [Patescibacteria group bacterium]